MAKGLVLISGVNGYIGAVAAKHFLDHGYSVRGTVRKAASAKELVDGPLKNFVAAGAFEVVEVPDITVEGAFDEAVKGVTAIAHLASPVSFGFKDPAPIIHAAVNGTKTVLHSAFTNAGPQLKTIVLMSSIASVKSSHPAPYIFTEKDWNDFAEKICEEQGSEAPGPVIYSASKVASEKAFWEFHAKNKQTFTMASVNPVFVIGPPLIAPLTASAIGETIHSIWEVFSGTSNIEPLAGLPQAVDVRDVAQLLRYTIENPLETNGERYIASASINHPQAVADILREEFKSDPKALARILEGHPGKGYTQDYQSIDGQGGFGIDSSKAKKLLEGGNWIPYQKSVIDTARTFVGLI
ncbi:putative NAD dependent epimerase/dehydratase [Pyrenochaeta sp. MPI-SDFR-AT-0127]|nr:putative NAD dependent epimerase/dehydratase [Pyrenochaeta sp. MPI-SDFR-AT-0127]